MPSISGLGGIGAYQAQSRSGRTQSQTESGVTAKVVTRDVGFRLGPFGVNFKSQDLVFDTPAASNVLSGAFGQGRSASINRAASFADELDIASIRRQMFDTIADPSLDVGSSADSGLSAESAVARRMAAEAYQAAGLAGLSRPSEGRMFEARV